jgi:hypothetical protein
MMDYIPFDFGGWTSPEGRECVVHGKQYGGPILAVKPGPGELTYIRQYCGLCLLAALDHALPPLVKNEEDE